MASLTKKCILYFSPNGLKYFEDVQWREKTRDFEAIYLQGVELLKSIEFLSSRKKDLGLSDVGFSVLLLLEEKFGSMKQLENEVSELLSILDGLLFPGWEVQSSARKRVEREIRLFLRRKFLKEKGLSFEELEYLSQKCLEALVKHADAY